MPTEKFYHQNQVNGDGQPPDLEISWGDGQVTINGLLINPNGDNSALTRLRKTINRAHKHATRA